MDAGRVRRSRREEALNKNQNGDSLRLLLHLTMMSETVIDLHSDDFFMGDALRLAAKADEAGEVPVGAVIVREGRIIARAFNQVELLKDATAHAEMLALTQAEEVAGDWRL